MTVHRWFAAKACPGDYLYERHGDIANRVNALLNPVPKVEEEEEEMTQEKFNEMMNAWLAQQVELPADSWSQEAREWAEKNSLVKGDEKGRKMYKKPLTREEFVTVLHRALNRPIL